MIIEPPNSIHKINVGCIMRYKGNFLLFHVVNQDRWSCLRGQVLDDESINMAIKREIREKLGLNIVPDYLAVTYHKYGDENIAYYLFKYEFTNDPTNNISLGKEYDKFELFNYADATKLKLIEDEYYSLKLYSKESEK